MGARFVQQKYTEGYFVCAHIHIYIQQMCIQNKMFWEMLDAVGRIQMGLSPLPLWTLLGVKQREPNFK